MYIVRVKINNPRVKEKGFFSRLGCEFQVGLTRKSPSKRMFPGGFAQAVGGRRLSKLPSYGQSPRGEAQLGNGRACGNGKTRVGVFGSTQYRGEGRRQFGSKEGHKSSSWIGKKKGYFFNGQERTAEKK